MDWQQLFLNEWPKKRFCLLVIVICLITASMTCVVYWRYVSGVQHQLESIKLQTRTVKNNRLKDQRRLDEIKAYMAELPRDLIVAPDWQWFAQQADDAGLVVQQFLPDKKGAVLNVSGNYQAIWQWLKVLKHRVFGLLLQQFELKRAADGKIVMDSRWQWPPVAVLPPSKSRVEGPVSTHRAIPNPFDMSIPTLSQFGGANTLTVSHFHLDGVVDIGDTKEALIETPQHKMISVVQGEKVASPSWLVKRIYPGHILIMRKKRQINWQVGAQGPCQDYC